MNNTNQEANKATNIRATNEARKIAQGVGIIFDSLQEMVDDIERKLIDEDKADTAAEKP